MARRLPQEITVAEDQSPSPVTPERILWPATGGIEILISQQEAIASESGYDHAIMQLDDLLDRDPEPGSEEYELLVSLSSPVEGYEAKHYPDERFAR